MYQSSFIIRKKTLGWIFICFFTLLCFFDLLYPSKGENVSRIVPVIGRTLFLFLCIFYVLYKKLISELKIKKTVTGGAFVILGILISVFSIIINIDSYILNINSVVKIIYWIFGFFFFYYTLLIGTINEKQLKYFVSIAVFIYFSVIIRDFNNVDLWLGAKEYFVSNNSYILLKLTPLVLLVHKRFKKVFLIIITVGIILSFKRGAILGIFLILLMYFFNEMKKSNNQFLGIFYLTMFSGIIYFFLISNLDVLFSRVSDFQDIDSFGSGRGKMFRLIINDMLFENFNILNFFFGNGFMSTKDFFGEEIGYRIMAHSDFFEFFYDFGILGLIIFLICIRKIYKLYVFFKKTEYNLALKSILLIIVLSAFFSINFFTPEMIYLAAPLALLEFKRTKIIYSNNI
jgi:hypothetical protein